MCQAEGDISRPAPFQTMTSNQSPWLRCNERGSSYLRMRRLKISRSGKFFLPCEPQDLRENKASPAMYGCRLRCQLAVLMRHSMEVCFGASSVLCPPCFGQADAEAQPPYGLSLCAVPYNKDAVNRVEKKVISNFIVLSKCLRHHSGSRGLLRHAHHPYGELLPPQTSSKATFFGSHRRLRHWRL